MSLIDYRAQHSGERVFIIGNGPSLDRTPLSLLEDEYSIAMNQIHSIFKKTDWRPTYYLQVNNPPYELERLEDIREINAKNITSFVGKGCQHQFEKELPNEEICNFVSINHIQQLRPINYISDSEQGNYEQFWSKNIKNGVYLWGTSLYAGAQIASYMGFDEIYFIGCDLYPVFKPLPHTLFDSGGDPTDYIRKTNNKENIIDFIYSGNSAILSLLNGIWFKTIYRTPLIDHLYKIYDYFEQIPQTHFEEGKPREKFYDEGVNQNLINIHKIISNIGQYEGFDCYNATLGGRLEVHERVDIANVTR